MQVKPPVTRRTVTEVLETVRRYYATGPNHCGERRLGSRSRRKPAEPSASGARLLRLIWIATSASIHVCHATVDERHFHVLVDAELFRPKVDNLFGLAEGGLHLIHRHTHRNALRLLRCSPPETQLFSQPRVPSEESEVRPVTTREGTKVFSSRRPPI